AHGGLLPRDLRNRIATRQACAKSKSVRASFSKRFSYALPHGRATAALDLKFEIPDALLANKFYGQAKGLISTGQLSTLLRLHFQPINLVVYQESHSQD